MVPVSMDGYPKFARVWLVAIFALALCTGCATVAPPDLSSKDLQRYRISKVDVALAPNAEVYWNDVTAHYVETKGLKTPPPINTLDPNPADEKARDDYTAALASPDAKTYMAGQIAAKIRPEVEAAFKSGPNGPEPARLKATVKSFRVLTAAERVVIGGNNMMVVDTVLLDASGKELARRDAHLVMADSGSGWLGVAVKAAMGEGDGAKLLATGYAEQFKGWLMGGGL